MIWKYILCISTILILIGCSKRVDEGTANHLEGEWLVVVKDYNGNQNELGILEISELSYSYQPVSEEEPPEWMIERFSFIKNGTGVIFLELENGPDDSTIAKVSFDEQPERFLVRINKDEKQLYFHAEMAELQLYEIKKSLD